jgi:hypothetical protein
LLQGRERGHSGPRSPEGHGQADRASPARRARERASDSPMDRKGTLGKGPRTWTGSALGQWDRRGEVAQGGRSAPAQERKGAVRQGPSPPDEAGDGGLREAVMRR